MQDHSHLAATRQEHLPPAWFEELASGIPIRAHFALSGNTRDLFPVASGEALRFLPLEATLWHVLKPRKIGALLVHDPVSGLRLHSGCDERYVGVLEKCDIHVGQRAEDPAALAALVTRVAEESRLSLALVIDYASSMLRGDPAQVDRLIVAMDRLARKAPPPRPEKGADWPPRNPVLWVLERLGDLPDWFATGNPGLRPLVLDLPDLTDRARFIDQATVGLPSASPEDRALRIEQLAVRCEGMQLSEVERVVALGRGTGRGFDGLAEGLRNYRIGTSRDPWTTPVMQSRVRGAKAMLERRVKGQTRAVERTYDILVRSIMGLSGAHTTTQAARPRGILFFVGPTGTGKTELAKSVTEVLFGDETEMVRFDMSEFMSEASIGRLIGPPPGMPGHQSGGELVNAVLQRPFSVFLFDEVEKAHPRILDAFLQILDDGRLSDTRGDTGYFSEALIIFTSNVGMIGRDRSSNAGQAILPSDNAETVERKLLDAVSHHFRTELLRPELMNRIGQNIVPFEFINQRSAEVIFDGVIERVVKAIKDIHGIEVTLADRAHDQLLDLCGIDLNEGGRGIGNRVETYFVNPLSRLLFEMRPEGAVEIAELRSEQGEVVLVPAGEPMVLGEEVSGAGRSGEGRSGEGIDAA